MSSFPLQDIPIFIPSLLSPTSSLLNTSPVGREEVPYVAWISPDVGGEKENGKDSSLSFFLPQRRDFPPSGKCYRKGRSQLMMANIITITIIRRFRRQQQQQQQQQQQRPLLGIVYVVGYGRKGGGKGQKDSSPIFFSFRLLVLLLYSQTPICTHQGQELVKAYYCYTSARTPNHQRWHAKWELSRNAYTLHTRFCTFRADLLAQSVLISKISASELSRKFVKSALLVGHEDILKTGQLKKFKSGDQIELMEVSMYLYSGSLL